MNYSINITKNIFKHLNLIIIFLATIFLLVNCSSNNTSLDLSKEITSPNNQATTQSSPIELTRLSIGTNLSAINDWSTQVPFLDIFKSSRSWVTQNTQNWDWSTGEESQLNLDANGWVKSLPKQADAPQYDSVGTVMYRDSYPGSKYIVLYQGEGTLDYGHAASRDLATSKPGRDVIDVDPSSPHHSIFLRITATDPNKTGNYIRNIRVIPEAYEKTYTSQIFNPAFLDKIKPFDALRFKDWMNTDIAHPSQWSQRPTIESSTWSTKGTPVEIMVKLANRTQTNPWFNMPHEATNEYVTNFAQYVKDHLDPNLKVYVEYSNEVWNSAYPHAFWVEEQGKQLWTNSSDNDYTKRIDWYSKRTTEIAQIWDQVFGTQKERVIGIMEAQAANTWTAQRALDYAWSSQPKTHTEYGIDAIAIAPYFGYYLGNSSTAAQVESWTKEPDGGLNKLFDELTQGGVISGGPQGGALQESYNWMKSYVDLAKQENLPLVAYEGGQHLVGVGDVQNNDVITNLFIQANRDPSMGEIYRQYFQKWHELGGGLFVNFTDITESSKYGSWGALENIYQKGSPKYDAIIELIKKNPKKSSK